MNENVKRSAVDEAREAAWRALRDDVTKLAHLTPDDWAGRRGADRIARTINACRDLIYEHQPRIEAAVRAECASEGLDMERLRQAMVNVTDGPNWVPSNRDIDLIMAEYHRLAALREKQP